MRFIFAFFFLILYVKQTIGDKSCSSFSTCGECIGYGEDTCVWCSEPNITTSRCQPEEFTLKAKTWCKTQFVYNPKMITLISRVNEGFRLGTGNLRSIQFTPQKMHLKMRPGPSYSFEMSYQPAKDFPLDVYYLMDYSYTMRSHVGALRKQATFVYQELYKFTNNVQFGLGSFIEKPDFPIVNPRLHYAYSFRNHLSLTSNISLFREVIGEDITGANFDDPEAGLDALMQVMACDKKLGWRSDARRIIVLFTDATYHSAGDGKMVGAGKPNDMGCHLNNTMFYDQDLIQDYPSVSQINKMASDGNFIIIFAALSSVKNEYTALARQITGAQYAQLKERSNILEIIKSAYLQSLGHLTIKYQWPPYVQLKLDPDCTINDRCEVGHKKNFTMKATLKVNHCPEKPGIVSLAVGPTVGGLEDILNITLDIDCQCECERDKSGISNSSMCSNTGTYQCGICKCNSDREGQICQCDKAKAVTSTTYLDQCKQNINGTSFCSGRGECKCGKCQCNTGFSGDFCEFDDNSCKRYDNKLCSGNGRCTHGACECDPDWTAEDCSCSAHKYNCFAPYSKEMCSGHGDCICDECVCHSRIFEGKNETYSGVFCEDCEDCTQTRCKELEDYAYCNYVSNKTFCDEQYNQTSNTEVLLLNKTEISASKWLTAKRCEKTLNDKSVMVFFHSYDKNTKKLLLLIQKETEAPLKANIWVPVGIAIGTVIFIGLLTVLAWKVLVDIMDEREYERFQSEAKAAGFDVAENPIYQPASVNFTNPAYNVVENTLLVPPQVAR